MADGNDETALRGFAKRHNVYFTIEPALAAANGAVLSVGFVVRLFAVHGKGARALPGGPRSRALAASLRSFAEPLLPPCGTAVRVEVEPFRAALYDSREVPGADEVALTIRLLHYVERYREPADASEQRWVNALRRRLKTLSLPER